MVESGLRGVLGWLGGAAGLVGGLWRLGLAVFEAGWGVGGVLGQGRGWFQTGRGGGGWLLLGDAPAAGVRGGRRARRGGFARFRRRAPADDPNRDNLPEYHT